MSPSNKKLSLSTQLFHELPPGSVNTKWIFKNLCLKTSHCNQYVGKQQHEGSMSHDQMFILKTKPKREIEGVVIPGDA